MGDTSPPWLSRFYPPIIGVDPMLAVGHQYMVVTHDHAIVFMDKNGTVLPSKNGEPQSPFSADAFFYRFLEEYNADGTENENCIFKYSPHRIDEFYDTRCDYDPVNKRFAILSAARKGNTADTRFYAFAVSKTEDPRDGFHQYMTTETNYRDYPRLTMNGDWLMVAHNKPNDFKTEGERPVMSAFHLPSILQGSPDPPNWQYYSTDLDGAPSVCLVSHRGPTAGYSFLWDLRVDKNVRVSAFSSATKPYLAPQPFLTSFNLTSPPPWPGAFAIYRNRKLYVGGWVQVAPRIPDVQPPRFSNRAVTVSFLNIAPVEFAIDNVVDWMFGQSAPTDAPGDLVSYDVTGMTVNKNGDAIYVYGRAGVKTAKPLFPEVRYSVWAHDEPEPRRSQLLQAGEYQPMEVVTGETNATAITHSTLKVDYATAVVDPSDDATFWVIHEYAKLGQTNDRTVWTTVIGKISPTLDATTGVKRPPTKVKLVSILVDAVRRPFQRALRTFRRSR